jgi:hypothetical protein
MVQRIKRVLGRKLLFFIGVSLAGILGILGSYMRTNYSKNGSLIVPNAHADNTSTCGTCGCPYTQSQCDTYWSCFPAGTPISTPSGDRAIQDLAVGDRVFGFDIKTGQTEEYPVTRTFKHGRDDTNTVYSPLIKITHAKGSLLVTDNHWIYRRNGRIGEYANFDRAGTLRVGDMLTTESGEEVAVTGIEPGPEYDFVYNLEVADVHTYFADSIRVHNSGPGGCCGSSGK